MVTPVLAAYGLLIFLPLVYLGAGLFVISIAMRDRHDHRHSSVPRLPTPKDHPLHHVRVSMAATRRKARLAARKAAAAADGSEEQKRKRPPRPSGRPGG